MIDLGTFTTKAGFAGDKVPRAIVRSIMMENPQTGEWECGDQIIPRLITPTPASPVERGIIPLGTLGNAANRKKLKAFLHHVIVNELETNPASHPLLLITNTKSLIDWNYIANQLFKYLDVPALYLGKSGYMCMDALGHSTALLFQFGAGQSFSNPIINYFGHGGTVSRHCFGSQEDVDRILHAQLVKRGLVENTFEGFEMARWIKEHECHTALDFAKENETVQSKTVTLPNGKVIECGKELIHAPEIMVSPRAHGIEQNSVLEGVKFTVQAGIENYKALHGDYRHSKEEWEQELLGRVVLSGGHVQMKGFKQRVEHDLKAQFSSTKVNVTVPEHPE
nr:hypothetical protein [Candidatus Sigynarchaeota archaeon]